MDNDDFVFVDIENSDSNTDNNKETKQDLKEEEFIWVSNVNNNPDPAGITLPLKLNPRTIVELVLVDEIPIIS